MKGENKISFESNERLVKLESAVKNIENEFGEIKESLSAINDKLNASKQTNWSQIFGAVIVAVTLWFVAIKPLNENQNRADINADKIAQAVLLQNDKIQKTEINQAVLEYKVNELKKDKQ